MTWRAALAGVPLLILAGCGDDSSGSAGPTVSSSPSSSPTSSPSPTYDGIEPTALVSCLTGAGQPATLTESTPLGVDVPVQGVTIVPAASGGQGVDLWVFEDAAAAAKNRSLITLSDTDTPTTRVVQNVVVRLYEVPARKDPIAAAVSSCLNG